MKKNTNEAVNFNQEVLDDNWQENKLRLALFVNRQKKAAQSNIDSNLNPNLQENPVLSNQSILIDDDQANISNFNLNNTNFFDSEQTILEDRDPNDEMGFNRLDNSQECNEPDSEDANMVTNAICHESITDQIKRKASRDPKQEQPNSLLNK